MSDVLSLLSEEDINKITTIRKTFSDRGLYCGNWQDTNPWLAYWATAKNEYLAQLFGDELILSKPVVYQVSDLELADRISESVFNHFSYFHIAGTETEKYLKWRETFYNTFLTSAYPTSEERCALLSLLDTLTLGSNLYRGENVYIKIPNTKQKIKIQNGCKASKIIGQLCKAAGIYELWEPVRLKISQIRNTSKLSGMLHLSIHPIDFMTASVNDYDWNSCMDFTGGDYRRGVIEMMNSPMVVQAYLTGSSETFVFCPNVSWYNKKWREFFLVTPTMISGIKGYPYWNQDLETIVLEWIYSLIQGKRIWANKIWSTVTDFKLGKPIPALSNKVIHEINCGPAMYDDFYSSETYQAIFAEDFNPSKKIFYSGFSECLWCGDDCEDYDSSSLTCMHCDNHGNCACCGDRYTYDEMYCVNDQWYCSYCYNELASCANCESLIHPEDNGNDIVFGIVNYDEHHNPISAYIDLNSQVWICDNCLSNLLKPNSPTWEMHTTSPGIIRYYTIVDINDIDSSLTSLNLNISSDKSLYKTYCVPDGTPIDF